MAEQFGITAYMLIWAARLDVYGLWSAQAVSEKDIYSNEGTTNPGLSG